MSSPEVSGSDEEPLSSKPLPRLKPAEISIIEVHPEVAEQAEEVHQGEGSPRFLNEVALQVEKIVREGGVEEKKKGIVYRTMGKVHMVMDLSDEEIEKMAENAKVLAAFSKR